MIDAAAVSRVINVQIRLIDFVPISTPSDGHVVHERVQYVINDLLHATYGPGCFLSA